MNLFRRELEAFFAALRFFTRLPVPAWVGHSAEGLSAAARYFPAVGLCVGAIGALVFVGAAIVWPTAPAILLSMLATILLTGAFHEDGLADTADGLGGGRTREAALVIMKDSRLGSYGAIAVSLALLLKFATLSSLPLAWIAAALIAGHSLSRFAATSLLASLDYAREEGKAKPLANSLSAASLTVATGFALVGVTLMTTVAGIAPVLAGVALAALATLWLGYKFHSRLGGYTGDCLGATQQIAEIAFYLGLLCSFT